jgi:hypothetical protein
MTAPITTLSIIAQHKDNVDITTLSITKLQDDAQHNDNEQNTLNNRIQYDDNQLNDVSMISISIMAITI